MLSSQGAESADDPIPRSSQDQDKPATTKPLAIPVHRGWIGLSDPLPRSVIADEDQDAIMWHRQQAQARALRYWADDLRGLAWVPGATLNVQVIDTVELFNRDLRVIRVHVPAFLLDADLDPHIQLTEQKEVLGHRDGGEML